MPDETKILIYVVDDDASVRQALKMLFLSAGMEVVTIKSAAEFIEYELKEENSCLIADIKMPGVSGLELQQMLIDRKIKIPVIFLKSCLITLSKRNLSKIFMVISLTLKDFKNRLRRNQKPLTFRPERY